jgi:hypothetical protein
MRLRSMTAPLSTALIGLALTTICLALGRPEAALADQFRRLTGTEIKTRFAGNMLTDDTHWRETYLSGGKLLAEQRGGSPMKGTWRVDRDELCTVLPGIRDACYSVWQSDNRIELRHTDYLTVEAFLRPPRQ